MNKRLFAVIPALIVIVAGGLIFTGNDKGMNDNSSSASNNSKAAEISSDSKPVASNNSNFGKYIEYQPDIIANTSGTKILFFYASWCPQCRALEADIKEKGVPVGVNIIKVDYDSNQDLRRKYGVTIQTTLVKVDDQGNLIEKYVSYEDPSLESVKRNLL